jgi:hypothetical protein
MLTEAVRLPLAVGLKVTLTVQLPPEGMAVPQLVVSGKSTGLAPITFKLDIPKTAFPSFVRVSV